MDRTDRAKRLAEPDVIEIPAAARLIRADLFVDGQRVGTTPDGHPIYCRHKALVVDMRSR
jgi:hypothetical protein